VSAKRKASYWLINIVTPMFLVVGSCFVFFAVEIDIVDGRANILLTTFLTTIAFKLFVSDKLPNLSYLSLIDYYILLCLLVQISMIIIIEYGGVQSIKNDDPNFILGIKNDDPKYDFGMSSPETTLGNKILLIIGLYL